MKDPYIELASAIIKQAAYDFKAVNTKIEKLEREIAEDEEAEEAVKALRSARGEKRSIIRFFEGELFRTLCDFIGLDSDYLGARIKERNISGK